MPIDETANLLYFIISTQSGRVLIAQYRGKCMLNDRHAAVLRTLVHNYIREGKPVGSRYLGQKYGFNLSSATIRNVMSDLELEGYIEQPHSSAGRIPTDKGYRYYVNDIMQLYESAYHRKKELDEWYQTKSMEIDSILNYTTHMLANFSHYTGIVIPPVLEDLIIKQVKLVNLGDGEVLAVFLTRSKSVINRRLQLDASLTNEELDIINSFLNETIVGYSFHKIKERIEDKLQELSDDLRGLKEMTLLLAQKADEAGEEGLDSSKNVIIDGIKNLVVKQDQLQPSKIEDILDLIENKEQLRKMLEKNILENGVQAIIGDELESEDIQGCTIITSSYRLADRNIGILGIIGPKRMEYDRMIPLVDNISNMVSNLLNKMSQ